MNVFATPDSFVGPQPQVNALAKIPGIGAPPSTADCNCDGKDDKSKEKIEKPKRPLISYSFSFGTDGNGDREVTKYDCSTSPNLGKINWLEGEITKYSIEGYRGLVAQHTASFSDQDKVCLAGRLGSLGNTLYDMEDGYGLYDLEEMHKCMQQAKNGDYSGSCRTCAPIHHYAADIMESMGGQCGLMVNMVHTYVNDRSEPNNTRRGMHYVNICKVGDKFFMHNYNRKYQLEAMTYQEAVDITNTGLGEGNWAGNQITCMDPGKSSLAECKHVYLSRNTRYQLSKIKEAIAQVDDTRSPIHIALSNISQEVRIAYPISTSKETKTYKDGDKQTTQVTHGFTLGMDRYRSEYFAQGGWVRRSQSEVVSPKGEVKRRSRQDLYLGVAGIEGNGALMIDDQLQDTASIVFYLNRDDQFILNEDNVFGLQTHVAFGSDTANFYRERNFALGLTDVLRAYWAHDIDERFQLEVSQDVSIMTDRANVPLPQIGKTTVRFNQDYTGSMPHNFTLTNSTAVHFLHGGFSDETFAFQNTFNLGATSVGPTGLEISIQSDLGYTTSSMMGRDVFYDEGIWGEGRLKVIQPLYHNGTTSLHLMLDGGATSGSRPAQFAIDPLTIEENPTRNSVDSIFNGFIRLGGTW